MYYVLNYNNGRVIMLQYGNINDCCKRYCREVAISYRVVLEYLKKFHIFESKNVYIISEDYLELKFTYNLPRYHSIHYSRGLVLKDFILKKKREIKINDILK